MSQELKVGMMLVAQGNDLHTRYGMRRVMIESYDSSPILYAVPCIPNDGMKPMPLSEWINSLPYGYEVVT